MVWTTTQSDNTVHGKDVITRQAPDACERDCPLASRGQTRASRFSRHIPREEETLRLFLDNHHGDGIVGVTCKVLPGENQSLVEAQPDRFYPPAYLASRGWVALRLDRSKIDWREVKELLFGSYAMIAPKRLAEEVVSDL